ncbi:helix-turn-helix domain-containing protein [Priestia megaterium]|uniref:helix-turn-helix domain-containing protein n=1 Tax=Priestia megaterium TaxID=1404 RepID=UPI001A9542B9|nr:helix-turn-helix domain-containing protein [Priestia megaterium]QSX24195.1 helix-turn-helix domain-containing protein [Priestia megaterium]
MDSVKVGRLIKELRKKAGMTQKELAKDICTQAQISNIEKGEQYPSSIVLYDICRKLDVDMNYIFNLKNDMQTSYVGSIKEIIRKHIRNRDYDSVSYVISREKDNYLFKDIENQQFLLWHEGICDYYVLKDKDKAISKLNDSLNLTIEPSKHCNERESEILNSIAIIYSEEREFEKAIIYYEKALKCNLLSSNLSSSIIKIRILYGLSKCLTDMERYNESLEYSKQGKDLCVKNETNYLLGELIYQVGDNLIKLGNITLGLKYLKQSITLFEIHDNYKFVEIVTLEKENIEKTLN